MSANGPSGALAAVESLRQRAKLSKDRHFAAADRKGVYHTAIGLPAVVINVFLGVVIGNLVQLKEPPAWASATAVGFSFGAACLSAILTFFNFARTAEAHRSVANRYLRVSTDCEHLLLENQDLPTNPAKLWAAVRELHDLYQKINEDAEAFPTSPADLVKARNRHALVPFKSPVTDGSETKSPNTPAAPPAAVAADRAKQGGGKGGQRPG